MLAEHQKFRAELGEVQSKLKFQLTATLDGIEPLHWSQDNILLNRGELLKLMNHREVDEWLIVTSV